MKIMEKKEKTTLKPKKKNTGLKKLNRLLEDKKKRYLIMFLFMAPFIIAIVIFGIIAYKEAKNLLNTAKGTEVEIVDEFNIPSAGYKLRDNATDLQVEYFTQLKIAIEEGAESLTVAELVAKNYIADFYTWTNKQGQYDVGGFNFVFNEKNESINFKDTAYTQARDGFYKYLNYYINQYGSDKLLEVENVEITSSKKLDYQYTIHQWVKTIQTGDETYDVIYEDVKYDAYLISCKWSYKPTDALKLSDYGTTLNMIVVNNEGRYEVAETSVTTIDAKPKVEENTSTDAETEEDSTEGDANNG
jgi:hypothetical protein